MMAMLLRTRRLLVVGVAAVAIAAVIAALTALDSETERASVSTAGLDAGKAVSVTPDAARGPRVEPRTRTPLGELALRGGKLRLERAEMSDGSECLLHAELGSGVSGSQCFQRGLFGSSRVAFSVNADGGPGTFSSMYVVGIAHPAIGRVELVRTDGSVVRAELTKERTFVVESSAAELERSVLPASLRVYAGNGRLVETVEIPDMR